MKGMTRIVIVGGGAGGLELATRLGRKFRKQRAVSVLLIDKHPFHVWKPLFHEVASGSLDVDMDGVDYRAHAANHGFEFQLGALSGLDRENRQIRLEALMADDGDIVVPPRTIDYDILVLAIGSASNDFSVPGVHEHCFTLDSVTEANHFHQRLLNHFLKMKASGSEGPLNVVVVGGGATGVELAAELYKITDYLPVYGFSTIQRRSLAVHLIEASDRILNGLPSHISQKASLILSGLGANILTNASVESVDRDGVSLKGDKKIAADVVVWCAGVKCQEALKNIGGLTTNPINQIVVDKTLRSVDDTSIYALGDCASLTLDDGSRVPPRAQSAHQMASCVCQNIINQLAGSPCESFTYRDHGSLVSFAEYSTVGVLAGLMGKKVFVEGGIAKYLYISLYRLHQIALHGYLRTALLALVGRINRRLRPALKLH
ncbi:NAD(P)/FAD-dependent oxidoreductase [Thalassolituus oleivorans]|uniref:NAD(P)/FAD-dependent oxidoreductase n=1 Tax=Thalassolituus oleivorans TaxID=187493 RepID=UPI0023EFC11B|nr:NAD(P)/FAD-dependent oxidoreductase [Thalassolituus oleivorans]